MQLGRKKRNLYKKLGWELERKKMTPSQETSSLRPGFYSLLSSSTFQVERKTKEKDRRWTIVGQMRQTENEEN